MIDLPALPDPLLTVHEAQPMADSRIVGKMFAGKPHRKVLGDIRLLLTRKPELEHEFVLKSDNVRTGNGGTRRTPFYLMTETGFMMLVMRYTGESALTIQLKFVQAFKAMRAVLNAERDLLAARMRDWELRERESAQRGTIGAKALCVRKREKPALEGEQRSILEAVQLTLRLNAEPRS